MKRLGGDEIERNAVDQGPTESGNAIATHAGSLAAAYVIHAVGVGHERIADRERLTQAIRAAISFAAPLQLRRIAFSLIGTEHGVFTAAEAADALLAELHEPDTTGHQLEAVVIATANAAETHAVNDAVTARRAQAR